MSFSELRMVWNKKLISNVLKHLICNIVQLSKIICAEWLFYCSQQMLVLSLESTDKFTHLCYEISLEWLNPPPPSHLYTHCWCGVKLVLLLKFGYIYAFCHFWKDRLFTKIGNIPFLRNSRTLHLVNWTVMWCASSVFCSVFIVHKPSWFYNRK